MNNNIIAKLLEIKHIYIILALILIVTVISIVLYIFRNIYKKWDEKNTVMTYPEALYQKERLKTKIDNTKNVVYIEHNILDKQNPRLQTRIPPSYYARKMIVNLAKLSNVVMIIPNHIDRKHEIPYTLQEVIQYINCHNLPICLLGNHCKKTLKPIKYTFKDDDTILWYYTEVRNE